MIVVAGLLGWLLARLAPQTLRPPAAHTTGGGQPPLIADDALHTERPSRSRALRMLLIGLLLWAAPLAAVTALTGTGSVFTTQGLFSSGTALVTFGGVYAVLAYVAQQAVQHYGWLGAGEMVRGTRPRGDDTGPLIMVVQFVAHRDPGNLNPWAAALLGALLTSWVTFVLCFLIIFLCALASSVCAVTAPSRTDRHHRGFCRRHCQPCPVLLRAAQGGASGTWGPDAAPGRVLCVIIKHTK
ncbi:chromate transporter [Streptomyces canus]|uniref:chromate transporter n=1 Tax=Streptomyces canus TaxID=58343 RepID=UPI0038010B28